MDPKTTRQKAAEKQGISKMPSNHSTDYLLIFKWEKSTLRYRDPETTVLTKTLNSASLKQDHLTSQLMYPVTRYLLTGVYNFSHDYLNLTNTKTQSSVSQATF